MTLAIPKRSSLLGSLWYRRDPVQPNDGWNQVRICGVFDLGNGNLEVVLSPSEFGSPQTCAIEALATAYTQAGSQPENAPVRVLRERLNRVGASQ